MNNVTVSVGDNIQKGQQIGIMGNTGSVLSSRSTYDAGTHLHIEFRTQDTSLLANLTQGKDYKFDPGKNQSYIVNPALYIDFGTGAKADIVAGTTGSSSSTAGQSVVQRGEIATKYDENSKVTDIKEDDKATYVFNNKSWINFVYMNSLHMKETEIDTLLAHFDTEEEIFKNELVKSGEIIDITKLVSEGRVIPGDVLYAQDGQGGGEYLLYVGGTKILYATPMYEENPEEKIENGALRYDYLQFYLGKLERNLLKDHEDDEDYQIPAHGITKIYRLKDEYIKNNQITQDKAN